MTPLYRAWLRMHDRCYNQHYHRFHRYGGRGIKVCSRWDSSNTRGFQNFLGDMGEQPGKGYSLNRIDNDDNYKPSNCRWATAQEQALNMRHPLGLSGMRGVWLTPNGKHRASIKRGGRHHHLGMFATATEASTAYETAQAKLQAA